MFYSHKRAEPVNEERLGGGGDRTREEATLRKRDDHPAQRQTTGTPRQRSHCLAWLWFRDAFARKLRCAAVGVRAIRSLWRFGATSWGEASALAHSIGGKC